MASIPGTYSWYRWTLSAKDTPAKARLISLRSCLSECNEWPSVSSAALTDTAPVWAPPPSVTFTSDGETRNAGRYVIGKDYFETLGIPVLLGRGFRKEDEARESTAVVVSKALVREYWKGMNPLGRRVELGTRTFEVVGVASDTRTHFAVEKPRPAMYFR